MASEEYGYLPERVGAPDWVLYCADGRELPCHGVVLAALSPVLGGLCDTQPRADGRIAVPFKYSLQVGCTFLQWAYKNHFHSQMMPSEVMALAALSHEWNIVGLTQQCDLFLARLAGPPRALGTRVLPGSSGEDLVEMALLATKCSLPETLARCELHIIQRHAEVVADPRLSEIGGASLQRIMLGVVASSAQSKFGCWACPSATVYMVQYGVAGPGRCFEHLACKSCGNVMTRFSQARQQALAVPGVQQLQEWACQMEAQPHAALHLPTRSQ